MFYVVYIRKRAIKTQKKTSRPIRKHCSEIGQAKSSLQRIGLKSKSKKFDACLYQPCIVFRIDKTQEQKVMQSNEIGQYSYLKLYNMDDSLAPFYNLQQRLRIMLERATKKHRLSPEQRLVQLMTEQYYNYVSLLKLTNNFEKRIQLYEKVDFEHFEANIAFIGNVSQITTEQNNKDYIFPIVNTPINRYLFVHQTNPYSRKPHNPIRRKLVIRQDNYVKALVLPFNKIISMTKKQKDQYFIFTHLNTYLKEDKELCFALTQQSHIIQLESQFYKSVLQPLQSSLETNFSELNLHSIYPGSTLQRGSTFVVNDLKSKLNQNINTFPVLGQLRKIHRDSYSRPVNAKQKQVVLDIIQETFPHQFSSLGLCRIYVRFDILDEQQMVEHMQEGTVYVFLVNEIDLNKNLQLVYKLNHWKSNMIKISRNPLPLVNLEDAYKNMKIGCLANMTYPCIFRNHYKFKVVKTDIKLMHLKVSCEKCEGNILRISQDQYRCRNQCGIINGKLKLWAIVGCMDQSGYAEITLENEVALAFFNLEEQAFKIKDQTLKEEYEPGKSITLYFKRDRERSNEEQFEDGMTYEKNIYLLTLLNKCQVAVIEKQIIATAKPTTNETFSNFEEGVKNEFQTSFAQSKQYFKKAKIFLNGQLRTSYDRIRLVPHLKAERVYPITSAI